MQTFHQLLKVLMVYAITAYINNTNMFISIRYHLALSATSGSYKSAGLPNIAGQTLAFSGFDNGAFKTGTPYGHSAPGGTDTHLMTVNTFNASRVSSVYGNSTTVQPPSFTVKYIIKY